MPALLDNRAYINNNFPDLPLLVGERVGVRGQMESVSKALKQRDGELLVCDVSLYLQLYQEHLQKSRGNQALAKKYTFEAIKKDGVALMQENISALSVNGNPLFDLESRARMQLTPTQNTYLLHQEETVDEATGQTVIRRKMVSPEHAYIGRSVTEALTSWRRGNDAAVMAQNENLFTNYDKHFNATKTHTLVWGSPMAKESEGQLIHKYNGEYGYLYVGEITEEAGIRKMILHSYKNDMSSEAYQKFMSELQGQEFFAGFGPQTTPQTASVDQLMRTSIMREGSFTPEQIYKQMFKVKKEVDGVDTMFGIDEKTLLAVQDPELRQQLENDASAEVALWLVDQLASGVDPAILQNQIKDKYIQATRQTIQKVQVERTLKNSANHIPGSIVSEDRVDIAALKAMKTNTGAFCGTWDTASTTGSLAPALSGFTTFSARGWGGGGESKSANKEYCNTCRQDQPVGSCKLCAVCFPE